MATSGGEQVDLEDESLHASHDPPHKKAGNKFLQPFRKMRRFFSSRRRGKGREGDEESSTRVSIKSKSTTDVLRAGQEDDDSLEEESAHLVSNKTLSMSADSVFTPDSRPKDNQIEGLKASARSMEQLGQPALTSELFQKLKSRRSEDEDDDGLPRSPVTQPSTRDVLDEFKKPKRHHDSKHSVDSSMSSEDELEDRDVFGVDWTAVTASKSSHTISDSTEQLNFDILSSSTSSLSYTGAKHKLEVSQRRNVRPSTQFRRPPKAQTPTSLPQVEEKEEIKAEEKDDKEDGSPPSANATVAEAEEEQAELLPEVDEERAVVEEDIDDEEETPEVEEEKKSDVDIKIEDEPLQEKQKSSESGSETQERPKSPSEKKIEAPVEKVEDKAFENTIVEKTKERPVTIVIPRPEKKSSPLTTPRSPKTIEKKEVEEPDRQEIEQKPKEPEESEEKPPEKVKTANPDDESSPFKVVLRKTGRRANLDEAGTIRRRDNVVDKDPTKRQTIAGDSGLMIFGDRKAGQRSSFVEMSHSPEAKDSDSGNNEFTQVLSRLKKQPSRKKLIPTEAEGKTTSADIKPAVVEPKHKPAKTPSPKPVEKSQKVVVIEAKSTTVESTPKKAESTPKKAESTPKKADVKPALADSKPTVDFSSKPKIVENKPKIAENKPKIADSKPKVIIETKSPIAKVEEKKKPEKLEVKPKETFKIPKESVVSEKTTEVKEKEVVIVSKHVNAGKPKGAEVEVSKSETVSSLKPVSVSDSKARALSTSEHKTVKKPEPSVGKTLIIEKPKPLESRFPVAEKVEQKLAMTETKAEDKIPKKDLSTTKSRNKNQTLTEQPTTEGANKENETAPTSVRQSSSHGDGVEERASPSASSSSPPSSVPTATQTPVTVNQESGKTSEPAWFTLARRKTANWGQKEKDQGEIKEKKETSNQAEKERGDAYSNTGSKEKPVTLTIDDAAKEESKPALRNVGKCSNSASSRQSKVLDMAKLFQNQVS